MIGVKIGGEVQVGKITRMMRDDRIYVGYPSGVKHPDSDLDNAVLAEILHFGSRRIPARSWLYEALSGARELLRKEFGAHWRKLLQKGELSAEKIGAVAVGAVQAFVRGGYYRSHVPNAPSTVRRKSKRGRSDVPLIDTAFLINSTTFVARGQLKKVAQVRMAGGNYKLRAGRAE